MYQSRSSSIVPRNIDSLSPQYSASTSPITQSGSFISARTGGEIQQEEYDQVDMQLRFDIASDESVSINFYLVFYS